jgi:dihydroorotate dehydrogenase
MDLYQSILRPLVLDGLKLDPELAHQQLIWASSQLNRTALPFRWLSQQVRQTLGMATPQLSQSVWGLNFANPIGLAAGFDKDGQVARAWANFGFGFAEIGTVTYHAQPGNPRPRLFRLPQDQAAINRMGFNNQGAAALAHTLQTLAQNAQITQTGDREANYPLGINLGKSKITPLETAASDYLASFRLLKPWGDYFVVNVSSPNTPGLRSLQSQEQLRPILEALQQENQNQKPLLVKIAPDLTWEDISDILDLAQTYQLAGIIATNTTLNRAGLKTHRVYPTGNAPTEEAGGLSGAPLRQRSTEVIQFIYQQTQGKLPIIGVGGVFTAADAWEKITAGASLVQVYTGWFYEGPWMVRRILLGLTEQLQQSGFSQLSEAVGSAHPIPSQKN